MIDEAAERARRTYDAADRYDALGFWALRGARTVQRLDLGARQRHLPGGRHARAGRFDAVVSVFGILFAARARPRLRAVGPAGPDERARVERRVREAMANAPPMVLAVARR